MLSEFNTNEFYRVLNMLDDFHSLIRTLWNIGIPYFDDETPTAAITFDKEGSELQFKFGKEFWLKLDDYERCFVIAHECLHILLKHGVRAKDCEYRDIANVAMDIAVNHMLIKNFGFDISRISVPVCLVETVFDKPISDDGNFEYYYRIILENAIKISVETIDLHGEIVDLEDLNEVLEINGLNPCPKEIKSEANIEKILEGEPGKGVPGEPLIHGNTPFKFELNADIKKANKWDSLFKKIERNYKDSINENFVHKNRRFSLLNKKFLIPHEVELEKIEPDRPDIFMFLDCSGSCHALKNTFWKIAQSINRKKFRVKYFSRTTIVQEFNPGDNITVDGSDDFRCIEVYIQKELKKKKIRRYPIVVHLTDGHDCSNVLVVPQKPENWYSILSSSMIKWCPKNGNILYLKDFE